MGWKATFESLRPRIERHALGPRVFVIGLRIHDWHLGALILLGLAIGIAADRVHEALPAGLAALAGVWLIAKDWRDLTSQRRDTAAWRLGLHRRPHPLRTFRRADPLPVLAALSAVAIACVDLVSALTPNAAWRGHVLLQVEPVAQLRLFHALAIPTAITLLGTAYYLFRRRLRALRFACLLLLALAFFNILKGFDLEEAGADLLVAGILWLGRGSFYVEHEPLRRYAALLRIPLVACAGFFTSLFLVATASRNGELSTLFRETGDLLLWQQGPIVFHDELARLDLAVELIGIATLAVIGYLVFRPLAAPRDLPDPEARAAARELVRSHGSDTLAYFKLRQDKHYLFSADRRAFLGYRVENGVLVVLGEPVGPPETIPELLEQLAAFAERRGLRIAAISVGEGTKASFEQLGLRGFYIGDEAIVETESFRLEGRAMRKVRQSVSRMQKAGYRSELTAASNLPESDLQVVQKAAASWRQGQRERGFSMALDPSDGHHEDTLLLLARDDAGTIRGFLHFVPTFGRDAVSLSTMLRDPDSPNGLTEYMIVEAIRRSNTRGITEVSLNFAAFARLLHSPKGPAERLFGRLLGFADGFFQIERLYRFNAKFQPRWEARYLMYEGPLSFPRTALATLWLEGQLPKPLTWANHRLRPPGRRAFRTTRTTGERGKTPRHPL